MCYLKGLPTVRELYEILLIYAKWQMLKNSVRFLANVNSRSCSLYVVVRPSVCLSSVECNVRAPYTQAIEIFGNASTPFGTFAAQVKFYGDRPEGTPPLVELNTRGVAKYSDFGPIERYISETVQDWS